ncbi:hypothetical protein Fot_32382 [Forsythia ovata]|uniref:Uncharacterized protein n=1 Tax=Forsythia ovata TaxID=205694 RepID=A0ABD1T7T3_9LAMI
MGALGSSTLPKIGLASLVAKEIPSVVKNKSLDNGQKKIFSGLILKGGEKNQNILPASVDLRQTILAPTASPQGLRIMAQKQEVGIKRMETNKEKGGVSSKMPVDEDEDVEVLKDQELTRKAKKPRTTSSKSTQNTAIEVHERNGDDKEVESRGSEGQDCDYSAHVRKFFKGGLLISTARFTI